MTLGVGLTTRLAGLGLFAVVLGCGQSSSTQPPAKAPAPTVAAAPTDAKGLFEAHCANCHAAGEIPRKGKGKGPDLSHVGSEPEHTAEWIADHVRNPKGHKPTSKMPAFESKLKPEEIKSVAEFLKSLK